MKYKIKQKPEDFVVKEKPIYEKGEGDYLYFWLIKTNQNTVGAVNKIASKLSISSKKIGFAGSKDKKAVTKQLVSIQSVDKEKVENLKINGLKLKFVGKGSKPISLGDLKENEFLIVVRDLEKKKIRPKRSIPNFFGPQRFSKNNADIGRSIIKRNFEKAVKLIRQPGVDEHLEKYPGDYIGAVRKVPLRIRRLYIHAYQSFIWNKTVKKYLKKNITKNVEVPIVGFGTELNSIKDIRLKEIIEDILDKEGITPRDFILRSIKELSAEGNKRKLYLYPDELDIEFKEDELNQGKLKAIVSFSLPPGSYATVVIEYLFSS